jgi:spore maturation protein CgeB
LFTAGKDYLMAQNGKEMIIFMRQILNEPAFAEALAQHGRQTILARHTCAHRVDQLMEICQELGLTAKNIKGVRGLGQANVSMQNAMFITRTPQSLKTHSAR